MKTTPIILAAVALAAAAGAYFYVGSASEPAPEARTETASAPAEGAPIVEVDLPAELSSQARVGKQAFDAVCAACHGENAVGRQGMGPPLVHKIYEPSHHGDMAFQVAVSNGVRAHHWRFGNMPPQEGLTRGDVTAITAYVRELQRENGIN
ncbi:c-type cytochrome [Salipiger mucosus]|uniref:Cytochrome c family protein n=1 Tax=Salipiger mucosus DSM 16094 TaxID=1123237 RepID=S9QL35_9RHOB|nr:cytochrome c [Salipiger mucosus]EPX82136.1 Cytochrome c family protein [Salipiger mucosus DSM 16094]